MSPRWLSALLLGSTMMGTPRAGADEAALQLTNYQDGTTIRYPVPVLRGSLTDKSITSIIIVNQSSQRPTRELSAPVHQGRFIALTELVPGANKLMLRAGKEEHSLTLHFQPQTNPRVVRVIYMTDNSGATAYQSPLDTDPQDYVAKLDTAMKLLQSFTAERMNDLGFGRQTFNLELEKDGRVAVHTLRGERPASFYYALNDQEWWRHVDQWLGRTASHPHAKNVVLAAYTRFDPKTGKVQGHTALGGGSLALFGSAGLFSWPSSIKGVSAAFLDERLVNGKQIHDDSAGRSTFWGLASTTLGATLHELGHTFGLPHSTDRYDIMTRGFDHFNRAFTLTEPPSKRNAKRLDFGMQEVAYFAPVSAAALKASPWFALDDRPRKLQDGPTITPSENGDVIFEAAHGIRYIGIDRRGDVVAYRSYWDKPAPPVQVKLTKVEMDQNGPRNQIRLRVIDDEGLQGEVETGALVNPADFVRSWQFSPITQPWTRRDSFATVDAAKLEEIQGSMREIKPVASRTAFVDFLAQFPGKTTNVAFYAHRTIAGEQARKVTFLVGSDDALRVWLNGKLVMEALALRPARPDENRAAVELRAGNNSLIVEVSQAAGGCGLFFRLTDEKGRSLRLTDTGRLVEGN